MAYHYDISNIVQRLKEITFLLNHPYHWFLESIKWIPSSSFSIRENSVITFSVFIHFRLFFKGIAMTKNQFIRTIRFTVYVANLFIIYSVHFLKCRSIIKCQKARI